MDTENGSGMSPVTKSLLYGNGFVSPYKTFGCLVSALFFVLGWSLLLFGGLGLIGYLIILITGDNEAEVNWFTCILTFLAAVVGVLFLGLHIQNRRKAKKNEAAYREHIQKKYEKEFARSGSPSSHTTTLWR